MQERYLHNSPRQGFLVQPCRYKAQNTRQYTPGFTNTSLVSGTYVPTLSTWLDMVGFLVATVGMKSIDPSTGNFADFSNRKACSLEPLPPNQIKVTLAQIRDGLYGLYFYPRSEFRDKVRCGSVQLLGFVANVVASI